ncbi:MAG: hypothetical protein H6726_27075 [Sandaracinaceae bacterium]|nr:hypothetical protein [Sandaracinaceae bacterium]
MRRPRPTLLGPPRRTTTTSRRAPLFAAVQLAGWGVAACMTGCSDPPPPRPPVVDGALFVDGGAGGDLGAGNSRPEEPRLPAADRTVSLPYLAPTLFIRYTVQAVPAQLDVHFSVDTTGSFGAEIDAMQRDLERRLIPEIRARVADAAFGVSRFEDFPVHPFGEPTDHPFELLSPISTDVARARAGVDALDGPLGSGGDIPEAGFEALYQVATGDGLASDGLLFIPHYTGAGLGGVGFRPGALHAIVHITDAPSHAAQDYPASIPGAHGEADVAQALAALPAYLLAAVGTEEARSSVHDLVVGSGATIPPTNGQCRTGLGGASRAPESGRCPLLFDIASDGTGLSDVILDAIAGLVGTLSFDRVSAEFDTDRLGFIASFEAASATPPDGVPPPTRVDSTPTDGILDAFEGVHGGTELVFDLGLRNVLLRQLDYEQVFRIRVRIVGDGVTLLEETVRVVVPAATPVSMDGGTDLGAMDLGGMDELGWTDGGALDGGATDGGVTTTQDASAEDQGAVGDGATGDGA